MLHQYIHHFQIFLFEKKSEKKGLRVVIAL